MPTEPTEKRLIVFIDGQALYRAAKDAFGYHHPNYDIQKLSEKIAHERGWKLSKIYFYTGVPPMHENSFWHQVWSAKLAVMGTRGIQTFTRPIRYQPEEIKLKDGTTRIIRVPREKGIDVRIALDVVRLALQDAYDVAVIFSQDQDLSEAVDEVKMIASAQKKWKRLASAYPVSPTYANTRGINKTDWIKIDKMFYDDCIDPTDYRPKRSTVTFD